MFGLKWLICQLLIFFFIIIIAFYILLYVLNTLKNWCSVPDHFSSMGTPFKVLVHIFYYYLPWSMRFRLLFAADLLLRMCNVHNPGSLSVKWSMLNRFSGLHLIVFHIILIRCTNWLNIGRSTSHLHKSLQTAFLRKIDFPSLWWVD